MILISRILTFLSSSTYLNDGLMMIFAGLMTLCVGKSSLTPTILWSKSIFILEKSLTIFIGLMVLFILDSSAKDWFWIKNDFCGDLGMAEIWLPNNWWNDLLFLKFCYFYKLSQGANLLDGEPLLNKKRLLGCGTVFPIKLETILICLFGLTLGPNVCTEDLLPKI